jgi:transducin (beta)-like 1
MDLREHTREVSAVRWSNTGSGSDNPSLPLVLASSSLDTSVKIWEPEGGKCLATLTRHNHPVTNIAFNPSGELLASGSHDRVHIWTVKDGRLVKTFKSPAGITDVSWHSNGIPFSLSHLFYRI